MAQRLHEALSASDAEWRTPHLPPGHFPERRYQCFRHPKLPPSARQANDPPSPIRIVTARLADCLRPGGRVPFATLKRSFCRQLAFPEEQARR